DLGAKVRGTGLIYGFEFAEPAQCGAVARECFAQGLVIEICGALDNVLKFLPPLTIDEPTLEKGLAIVRSSIEAVRAAAAEPAAAR
ncbi:MAG: aminotransferase class III-fold pyridoxal phosphate-dependent enzyme, partial [Opitutaceae bacterium]